MVIEVTPCALEYKVRIGKGREKVGKRKGCEVEKERDIKREESKSPNPHQVAYIVHPSGLWRV